MLRFALVGCGRIAKRHAELLGKGQIAHAQLAAVCDLVPRKAEPGDTIVVPLNAEHIPPLPLWQAVSQILYNVAVAVRR